MDPFSCGFQSVERNLPYVMSDKLPTIELIVRWLQYLLQDRETVVVWSHHMDTHVPQWVQREYGRRHNAETYARKWRRLRSDQQHRLSRAGLRVVEIPPEMNPKDSEKGWQIQTRTNGSKSPSTQSENAARAST